MIGQRRIEEDSDLPVPWRRNGGHNGILFRRISQVSAASTERVHGLESRVDHLPRDEEEPLTGHFVNGRPGTHLAEGFVAFFGIRIEGIDRAPSNQSALSRFLVALGRHVSLLLDSESLEPTADRD